MWRAQRTIVVGAKEGQRCPGEFRVEFESADACQYQEGAASKGACGRPSVPLRSMLVSAGRPQGVACHGLRTTKRGDMGWTHCVSAVGAREGRPFP